MGLNFRCHVGHAYSGETLGAAQNSTIETALWTALRALNESASFDERLATRSEESGLAGAAKIHRANAEHKHAQARQIEEFLARLRSAV